MPMDSHLKNRLLEVAGAMASSDNGRNRRGRKSSQNGDRSDARGRSGEPRRSRSLTEEEVVRRLSGKRSKGRGNARLRRRFLVKLAIALHSYGGSASRTEYLIEKAGNRLDVDVNVAVFPSLILLSFPGVTEDDNFHLISVDNELDVDKLGRADLLANHVGKEEAPLLLAYWRLKAIATAPPKFGEWWWRLFGYSLSASMSALLFFNGTLWDATMSLFLGFIVGVFDLIATKSNLFASVLEFVTALVVSLFARLFSVYLKSLDLCFFSMVLASLVQLLPGLSLTQGVSEMVAKAHVTGLLLINYPLAMAALMEAFLLLLIIIGPEASLAAAALLKPDNIPFYKSAPLKPQALWTSTSRIMYALFSALQLGFGIAVGENIVFWQPAPATMECEAPDLSIWWSPLWFAGFSVASNVLLNARLDQWPGMVVTSGVGFIVSTIASLKLGGSASSVIAAFAVGVTGTAFSSWRGDLPLVMVLSGVLLLVPGGIGVQGVAAMLQDDVLSGMGFVFDMMVVGLSITIGLLLAKLALPAALFGIGKTSANNKKTLAAEMQDETVDSSSDEEEDMAI